MKKQMVAKETVSMNNFCFSKVKILLIISELVMVSLYAIKLGVIGKDWFLRRVLKINLCGKCVRSFYAVSVKDQVRNIDLCDKCERSIDVVSGKYWLMR